MEAPIYLDYNATTPVSVEALAAMMPYFRAHFGNAASHTHSFGWRANSAVELARQQVASAIGAHETEIVFTSGATESLNLAIKGVVTAYAAKGNHVITASTEHKAVLDALNQLAQLGQIELTVLPVDKNGEISPAAVESAIQPNTILVVLMWANNETGVIHPIETIGGICKSREVLFCCDATQALGKIPLQVENASVDLLAVSAHKVYGPKGVGALYVRRKQPRVVLQPQQLGGGHERNRRSGTLNVPGIVGFGAAVHEIMANLYSSSARMAQLRDHLEQSLQQSFPALAVNGISAQRLPNTSNLRFPLYDGAALLMAVQKQVAISAGSACTSASPSPSHVLKAMGLSDKDCKASLRFSLGTDTTAEEINITIDLVTNALRNLMQTQQWQSGGANDLAITL